MKRLTERRLVPSVFGVGVSLFLALAACGGGSDSGSADRPGGDDEATGSAANDDGKVTAVTAVATGGADFTHPFDSTPDPAGKNVYFTAIGADGMPSVFTVPAAGGSVKRLFSGAPLAVPLGITITEDGKQLIVADPFATTEDERGRIYAIPTAGGAATAISGTDGYKPTSVTVAGSTLYFSGHDRNSGEAGVFRMPVAGGEIQTVVAGHGLVDLSGVAATIGGDVYVVETIGGGSHGVVYHVVDGKPVPMNEGYRVGYPAGLALSGDGTSLLASAIGAGDELHRIDLATKETTINDDGVIGANTDAAGLHRAHQTSLYSWVDSTAGGTGTIYVLSR